MQPIDDYLDTAFGPPEPFCYACGDAMFDEAPVELADHPGAAICAGCLVAVATDHPGLVDRAQLLAALLWMAEQHEDRWPWCRLCRDVPGNPGPADSGPTAAEIPPWADGHTLYEHVLVIAALADPRLRPIIAREAALGYGGCAALLHSSRQAGDLIDDVAAAIRS